MLISKSTYPAPSMSVVISTQYCGSIVGDTVGLYVGLAVGDIVGTSF